MAQKKILCVAYSLLLFREDIICAAYYFPMGKKDTTCIAYMVLSQYEHSRHIAYR